MVLTDSISTSVVGQNRVVIQNSHGEKLVGILHETGSPELVIICHGFRSSKDRIPMVNLASVFGKEGISAFRFDFAGNGESEGSFQYGNYRREADDLRAVVNHFCRDKRRVVAIIGHSKGVNYLCYEIDIVSILQSLKCCSGETLAGGNAVLLYSSKYNDIQTVVNIAGRYNLKRGIEGRLGEDFQEKIEQNGFIDVKNKRGKIEYRVTKESLIDRLTTNTCAACQSIHPSCRVLTIHGTKDEFVPVEDAMEFAKCIPNHKLQIVEGADHYFTSYQDELAAMVLDFVKTGLDKDKHVPKTSSTRSKTDKLVDSRL